VFLSCVYVCVKARDGRADCGLTYGQTDFMHVQGVTLHIGRTHVDVSWH